MAIDPAYLKAAAQRALAGAVGPHVLAVGVAEAGTRLVVTAYAAGALDEAETENLDSATAEIIADCPDATGIDLRIVEQARPPFSTEGIWAYVKPGTPVA